MHYFCTYFDSNYLVRGLTLYRSLIESGCKCKLFVLAMDARTLEVLGSLGLEHLEAVPLGTLEAWAPELSEVKDRRSLIEYYFTLSPYLPLYLLQSRLEIPLITYLDADLYFYSSPEPLFTELGDRSILAIEHRYSPSLKGKEVYGRFNVQYLSFRRSPGGMDCLDRWRAQCHEWCYDRPEDGKYGDQKYLDEWPERYRSDLVIARHPGAGVAPWNWAGVPMPWQDGKPCPDGEALIFYHFHGVKIFSPHFISTGLLDWGLMPHKLCRWFYAGYVRELRKTCSFIMEKGGPKLLLKDHARRGSGVRLDTLGEILRKAYHQALVLL